MTERVDKITGLPGIYFGAKSSIGISCNSSGTALHQSLGHLVSCSHFVPNPSRSCNSPGTRIGLPGPSRAHRPARWHRFVSIERREPLQTALQGTSARAMFCWKIAELTQNCHARPSEPGWCPVPHVPAIHLTRQSPFYGTPRHIRSRDGTDLCPSSTANPSRHRSKAHSLAR